MRRGSTTTIIITTITRITIGDIIIGTITGRISSIHSGGDSRRSSALGGQRSDDAGPLGHVAGVLGDNREFRDIDAVTGKPAGAQKNWIN